MPVRARGPESIDDGMGTVIQLPNANIPGDIEITEYEDGSVDISPAVPEAKETNGKFDQNLATTLNQAALDALATEVLEGVDVDIQSRQPFMDNYAQGLDLLGLKIETAANVRGQKRNISRIGHPLLLEAVVKSQSLARGELLPAAGPCKGQVIGQTNDQLDLLAQDFESDFNYYLTQIDKGFYPDTDRGLFTCYFGGNLFKKVYVDPISERPVSRSIQVEDLIVSQDATDLYTALRVTHRHFPTPNLLKRMMMCGAYRTVDIGSAQTITDTVKTKKNEVLGLQPQSTRLQDQEHTVYETYLDYSFEEFGHKEKGQKPGQNFPYKVSVDKDTRQVLEVRRNWIEGDKLFSKRQRFVHYGLIPAFEFLCLGYVHLLGNQTKALRAIWRLLIDAGMFGQFPGGMKAKSVRTDTNEITPGPGEWVDIDIGPFDDISKAFMPMPYKDVSSVFIQFAEMIQQDAQRLGGTADIEIGEGRSNVPVGTMMSMIEAATQVMAASHKRLHRAMSEELSLLKELFVESPKALIEMARAPKRAEYTAEEMQSVDIVPATDPNVPAQMHRNMLATALVTLYGQFPQEMDGHEVITHAVRTIGISDPERFVPPPKAESAPPDPKAMADMAKVQVAKEKLQLDASDSQRKAANELAENAQQDRHDENAQKLEAEKARSSEHVAEIKEETARLKIHADLVKSEHDREHERQLAEQERRFAPKEF